VIIPSNPSRKIQARITHQRLSCQDHALTSTPDRLIAFIYRFCRSLNGCEAAWQAAALGRRSVVLVVYSEV
jgi:hypothetical protein